VASLQECEAALRTWAALRGGRHRLRAGTRSDRTVSCRVPDLAVVFSVRLSGQASRRALPAASRTPSRPGRLTAASDDLSPGPVTSAAAAAGRRTATVEASVLDLLRLRSLL
jgi:hypothetical protein